MGEIKELILVNCEGPVLKFRLQEDTVMGFYDRKKPFSVSLMDFLDFMEVKGYSLIVEEGFKICLEDLYKSMGKDSFPHEDKINRFIREVKNNLLSILIYESINWEGSLDERDRSLLTIDEAKKKFRDLIYLKYRSYMIS